MSSAGENVAAEGADAAEVLPKRRNKRRVKPPLLTRASLDGRTCVAKAWDERVAAICTDLGGRDQLSTVQLALVEAFAGACVNLDAMNAKMLMGKPNDLAHFAQVSTTCCRLASRLGLKRVPKDVTPPSVADYLAHVNNNGGAA